MLFKKSQIWVETVIYTLIGLTLIAIVFSIATPQIQIIKDKSVISQTADSLLVLNKELLSVGDVSGNVRIVQFKTTKGSLTIDETNDTIFYVLEDTSAKFSEPGVSVVDGDITYLTQSRGRRYTVKLLLAYDTFDISTSGQGSNVLSSGGVTHKIRIENLGFNQTSGKTMIGIGTI